MEVSPSGAMQAQNAAMAQSKDIAMIKKSIDAEKDMAMQLLEGISQTVDQSAAAGQRVNMIA